MLPPKSTHPCSPAGCVFPFRPFTAGGNHVFFLNPCASAPSSIGSTRRPCALPLPSDLLSRARAATETVMRNRSAGGDQAGQPRQGSDEGRTSPVDDDLSDWLTGLLKRVI